MQYLRDAWAAHAALETALQTAAGVGAGRHADSAPFAALAALPATGLQRADALLADLKAIIASPPPAAASGSDSSTPASASPSTSSGTAAAGGAKAGPKPLAASQMAKAYADYIASLGRCCSAEDDTQQQREAAACQLLAHAYALHVAHLTSGTRVGAAATEKLNLFACRAVASYHSYPEGITDPMAKFQGWLNAAGAAMSGDQREALFGELPKAISKTGLLLMPLAHEN